MNAPFNDSDLRLATDALNRILSFNHQRSQQRDRLPDSRMATREICMCTIKLVTRFKNSTLSPVQPWQRSMSEPQFWPKEA